MSGLQPGAAVAEELNKKIHGMLFARNNCLQWQRQVQGRLGPTAPHLVHWKFIVWNKN